MALSADGNTALIGGPHDNDVVGRGVGVYALGVNLDPAGPKARRHRRGRHGRAGWSVALSADGNTALIGGPERQCWRRRGGMGIYPLGVDLDPAGTQAGRQRRRRLAPSRAQSVALSADGNTALIGGWATTATRGRCGCSPARGRPGPSRVTSSWAGAGGDASRAWSVSLSGDGNTALIGGHGGAGGGVGASSARDRRGPSRVRSSSAAARSATPMQGYKRGAVGRREHCADAASETGGRGSVGLRALGIDVDPAGSEVGRDRRRFRVTRASAWRCLVMATLR